MTIQTFTKITLILCYFLVFQFANFALIAQERGDPNLKPYKLELKKAKDGNLKSALLIAKICKADPLESGLYKDYKKAVEWYGKALADNTDSLGEAAKGMFEIYMTGGYGSIKDLAQARKYHQLLVKQAVPSVMLKIYHDKKNLDLREFFLVFDAVRSGQKDEDKLKLARMFWEFGINPLAGLDSISQLATKIPDALYLAEKWQLEAKFYFESHKTDIPNNTFYNLVEKHVLMGSNLARSEWALRSEKASQNSRFYLKSDEMQRLLATYTDNDIEMQFKMQLILQKFQKGVQHYATLRKINMIAPQTDSITQTLGKTAVNEFIKFDSSIRNISDLVEEMRENNSIKLFDVDITAYNENFNGSILPLLKLEKELQKPDVLILAGETNFAAYMLELNKKILPVFNEIDQLKEIIEFKKAYDEDTWLSYFKTELDTLINCRLHDFEVNSSNINFYNEMLVADKIIFKSLNEGKQYLYNLQSRVTDPVYRSKIASYLKEKIIQDVVGNEPTKEQIEYLQKTVDNESWLQPEGKAKWFHYTSDSKNWFSGKVERQNITYAYTVIKQTAGEKYELTIKAISDERSSLAYSANLKISETQKGEYTVMIFFAKYVNYGWNNFDNDYLRVVYKHHEPLISAAPAGGNISACFDKNHGQTAIMTHSKAFPADFSEKTAIRTAVQYFILEYTKAFLKQ